MIEISGAQIYFFGEEDEMLASMAVPVRLETFGQVTLIVEPWTVPAGASAAVKYQIRLPMPVMYEASPRVVVLMSQRLPISPHQTGEGEG